MTEAEEKKGWQIILWIQRLFVLVLIYIGSYFALTEQTQYWAFVPPNAPAALPQYITPLT